MTPFIAYLCTLPTEEKYFINYAYYENWFTFTQNWSLVSCNVSQLTGEKNGYVSIIINNATLESIGDGAINLLNYDRFNGVILYQNNPSAINLLYMLYYIVNIEYTSSTNIKITMRPSQQILYNKYDADCQNSLTGLNEFSFKTSFVEWGYRSNSIYKFNNNTNKYEINFSNKMDTDLYCKPPIDIKTDVLKWQNNRMDFTQSNNSTLNNICNDSIWEVIFIQPNKYLDMPTWVNGSIGSELFITLNTKKKIGYYYNEPIEKGSIEMPYYILFAPISRTKETSITKYLRFKDSNNQEYYFTLEGIKRNLAPYIISYQILPYMNLKFLLEGTDFSISGNYVYMQENNSNDYIVAKKYSSLNETKDGRIEGAYFAYKCVDWKPLTSTTIYLSTLKQQGYPDISKYSNIETAINLLSNYNQNPYINLHTTKLAISFNDGQKYFYDSILLGYFDYIDFKLYMSLEPDITQTYIVINTDRLEQNTTPMNDYGQSLTLNANKQRYMNNYFGLNINFDNTLLYSQEQLASFMAQNKNFYQQKNLSYQEQVSKSAMGLVGGMGTGLATTALMGNPLGLVLGGAYGLSNLAKTGIDIIYDKQQTQMQLNNLQSAPNQMLGGNTNMILENNVLDMGFYLQIWSSNDLVKKTLFENFIEKGIYINRYVDENEIQDFLTHNDNNIDKRMKFFKGKVEMYKHDNKVYSKNVERLKNNLQNGLFLINVDHNNYYDNVFKDFYSSDNFIKRYYSERDFG